MSKSASACVVLRIANPPSGKVALGELCKIKLEWPLLKIGFHLVFAFT